MVVYDKDKGFGRIKRLFNKFQGKNKDVAITVGVHSGEGEHGTSGETIAEVGYFNEFGTSQIPQRSFLRTTADKEAATIRKGFKNGIGKAMQGQLGLEQLLGLLGELAKSKVQQAITDIKTPPNAPSTIKRKGSNNPLIDTGQLRRAITYKVEQ